MRKEYNNIINKFIEFKKRFDKVDQEIDMDSSSVNFCNESNDSSTHHKYKIYPNIYNWFNRSERRVLKRNGINIDNYVRDDINYDDSTPYDSIDKKLDDVKYSDTGFGIMIGDSIYID